MITLAEELVLLVLDDDHGTVSWQRSTALPYGLGGALLMDLALHKRIVTLDSKIIVGDSSPTGDDLLDAALRSISASRRWRDAKHWVQLLGRQKGLRDRLARRLVARGILREQAHSFLWVVHDQRFPTTDPGQESALRTLVREVVLADAEPDSRTLSLLSLVKACHLTDDLFSREERKQAERRITALVEGEPFGEAVSDAIASVVATAAVASSTAISSN
jgi:Golgi phosphoprotein 3